MSYKDSMSCLSMRTNVIVCPHSSAHLALTGPQVEEGWKVSRPRRAACDSSSGRVCQEESLYQDQTHAVKQMSHDDSLSMERVLCDSIEAFNAYFRYGSGHVQNLQKIQVLSFSAAVT